MSEESGKLTEQYVIHLDDLTSAIESGDTDRVEQVIAEITNLRESILFQELGMLTREIHDSINSFANDERISELAEEKIPDAKERLSFIVTKTDEAAHRTMTGAEETVSLINEFSGRAQMMLDRWRQFRNRELSRDEFVVLNRDLDLFLESVDLESNAINGKMTDIMLAQDYQDITGQMIKQVVNMVQEVEEKLVRLIRISGASAPITSVAEESIGDVAEGPQLPNASAEQVAQSQGDVDDLLASLGF